MLEQRLDEVCQTVSQQRKKEVQHAHLLTQVSRIQTKPRWASLVLRVADGLIRLQQRFQPRTESTLYPYPPYK